MHDLNLPRPEWMGEDLVVLEEQARRFIADEFTPHLDAWHEKGIYPREVWTKAGQAGLLCATMAASIPSARRCIPASLRPTFCITAPRSRRSAGCPSSRPAKWSAPSP
jgi:hypothetical protein